MITESEAVNRLLERRYDEADVVEVESHYNYFGDRGVADLYAVNESQTDIYEIKGEAALDEVTGANEIVRQFNRMREYYFRDESNNRRTHAAVFYLCFIPTERVIKHLQDNLTIYTSLVGTHRTESVPGGVDRDITEVQLLGSGMSVPITEEVVYDEYLLESLSAENPIKEYRSHYE